MNKKSKERHEAMDKTTSDSEPPACFIGLTFTPEQLMVLGTSLISSISNFGDLQIPVDDLVTLTQLYQTLVHTMQDHNTTHYGGNPLNMHGYPE